MRKLHQDRKVSIYYSTIIEDNKVAIKILTSKKSYLPAYHDIGRYCTFAVSLLGKQRNYKNKLKIISGSDRDIKKIVHFLNNTGAKKQFYPYSKLNDFNSKNKNLIGFDIKDFYVAMKDDKIVGVIGKWDQRRFRQIIITGYRGVMLLIKPIYNTLSNLFGFSPLPQPNSQLNFFYVSFIAIKDNDSKIFRELLYALYNDFVGKNYSHLLIGLHSRDALSKVLDDFTCIKFNSKLFIVYWQDGENVFKQLDSRIPYVELATL